MVCGCCAQGGTNPVVLVNPDVELGHISGVAHLVDGRGWSFFVWLYQKRARGAYIVEVLYKLTEDVHVEGDLLLELQCRL